MASLLDRLGRIFKTGYSAEQKRKKICHKIRMNENPEEVWSIVGELGDGAFGKVFKVRGSFLPFIVILIDLFFLQAQHKESGIFAAAKICEIQQEEDLDDFVVEIDILSECKHKNIVELLEAYFFEDKLWVSVLSRVMISLCF